MFYAISKRRRDINAAEARGRKIGLAEVRAERWAENYTEGWEEGRTTTLDDLAARLKDNPEAIAVIAELRAQPPNGLRR